MGEKKSYKYCFRWYRYTLEFEVYSACWNGSGCCNPSSMKPRTYQSYNVNTMTVDDLVTQGARTSIAMVLTYFAHSNPGLTGEGLIDFEINISHILVDGCFITWDTFFCLAYRVLDCLTKEAIDFIAWHHLQQGDLICEVISSIIWYCSIRSFGPVLSLWTHNVWWNFIWQNLNLVSSLLSSMAYIYGKHDLWLNIVMQRTTRQNSLSCWLPNVLRLASCFVHKNSWERPELPEL